jgi:hypothetical protein
MALTTARNTKTQGMPRTLNPQPVAANTTLHVGGLACLDANGDLVPAQRTGADNLATLRVWGVVGGLLYGYPGQEPINTSAALIPGTSLPAGAAGAIKATGDEGTFLFDIGGATIAQKDIGALCYAEDDHTVYLAQDTTRPIAGTIVGLEAGGVWVDTRKQSAIG